MKEGDGDGSDARSEAAKFRIYEVLGQILPLRNDPSGEMGPKTHQKNKKPQREATPIARASSQFPHESTVMRAMRGDPGNGDNSSSSSSTEGGGRNDRLPPLAAQSHLTTRRAGTTEETSSRRDI